MARLVCSGEDIGFTILPYTLDDHASIQEQLIANPSDYVLGYITFNKESDEYKFAYTESGEMTEVNNHWSLAILKDFPYRDNDEHTWIVYNCSPRKTLSEFNKILGKYFQALHIYNWDTWSVEAKDAKVVVITSWEIY